MTLQKIKNRLPRLDRAAEDMYGGQERNILKDGKFA